jgi:photosystem II stability/assembly factor-like uncharacterized protein
MSNIFSSMFALICFFASIAPLQAQTNSWQQTDFAPQYGGSIEGLYVSQDGILFADAYTDGLIRSTDNGKTWKRVLQSAGYGFQIASSSVNSIFCTGGSGGRLLRSTDKGESWIPIGPVEFVRAVAVNSADQVFISCGPGKVYRSDNNGLSWTLINNGLPSTSSYSQIAFSLAGTREILFLLGRDNNTMQCTLYRSTNNGDEWTGLMTTPSNVGELLVHSNGYLFLDVNFELMRSTNNGDSWQVVSRQSFAHPDKMISFPDGDIWLGTDAGFFASTVIFRSTDDGQTWIGYDTLATGGFNVFGRGQDGSIFMGTNRSGLFKTTDKGMTWSQANIGFPNTTTQITSIAGTKDGFMIAGTSQFGSFISTNAGANWIRNDPGLSFEIYRIVIHPTGRIFAHTSFGYPTYSTDRGNRWDSDRMIYGDDLAIDGNGNIYEISNSDPLLFGGFHLSRDIGHTWTKLPSPGDYFEKIHVTRQGTIVVLTFNSIMIDRDHAKNYYHTRTSTDGGSTWIKSSPGDSATQTHEYTSTSNNFLFAGTQAGIYRSTDSGHTWEATGLTFPAVKSLAANSSDFIFAGTDSNGVFYSTNYGVTWESLNAGLTDTAITALYCDADGYLFAGTYNKGIFRTVGRTTAVDNQIERPPITFSLHQNYPNPFNPSTKIRFQIPHSALVTLKVFDLLGREVATLVNEKLSSGNYEKTLDARGLASGVYLYRLTDGTLAQTRKLLVLR